MTAKFGAIFKKIWVMDFFRYASCLCARVETDAGASPIAPTVANGMLGA